MPIKGWMDKGNVGPAYNGILSSLVKREILSCTTAWEEACEHCAALSGISDS